MYSGTEDTVSPDPSEVHLPLDGDTASISTVTEGMGEKLPTITNDFENVKDISFRGSRCLPLEQLIGSLPAHLLEAERKKLLFYAPSVSSWHVFLNDRQWRFVIICVTFVEDQCLLEVIDLSYRPFQSLISIG